MGQVQTSQQHQVHVGIHTSSSWLVNSVCSFSFSILLLFIVTLSLSLGLLSSCCFTFLFRCSRLFSLFSRTQFKKAPPDRDNSPRPAAVLLTRASHYFGDINLVKTGFVVWSRKKLSSATRCSVVRYFPAFPVKLLRWILLLFPVGNTVNVQWTAPQANFSPHLRVRRRGAKEGGREGGLRGGAGPGVRPPPPTAALYQVLSSAKRVTVCQSLITFWILLKVILITAAFLQ